jgi:hypothetical protein
VVYDGVRNETAVGAGVKMLEVQGRGVEDLVDASGDARIDVNDENAFAGGKGQLVELA